MLIPVRMGSFFVASHSAPGSFNVGITCSDVSDMQAAALKRAAEMSIHPSMFGSAAADMKKQRTGNLDTNTSFPMHFDPTSGSSVSGLEVGDYSLCKYLIWISFVWIVCRNFGTLKLFSGSHVYVRCDIWAFQWCLMFACNQLCCNRVRGVLSRRMIAYALQTLDHSGDHTWMEKKFVINGS